MSQVLFPILSEKDPDAEGTVATWFVDSGATVAEGELIAEVAVDKIDMEINAPSAGVLTHLVEEGAVVIQNSAIANIA